MKRILFLTTLLLLAYCLPAQIELGLQAGLNQSGANLDFSNLNLSDVQSIPGTRFAGIIHLRSNKRISLQSELALTQRGFAFDTDSVSVRSLVSSYLELPLMVRANLKLGKLRVHVAAGPSGSLLVGANQVDQVNGQPDAQQALDIIDSFQRIDLSFNAGAGVGVKLGPGWLELAARSSLGLTDIFADGPNPLFNGLNSADLVINNAKSNVNMVSLSYMIPLLGK